MTSSSHARIRGVGWTNYLPLVRACACVYVCVRVCVFVGGLFVCSLADLLACCCCFVNVVLVVISSLAPIPLFLCQDQSTVAKRAETTVNERFLTSCV